MQLRKADETERKDNVNQQFSGVSNWANKKVPTNMRTIRKIDFGKRSGGIQFEV